MNVVELDPELAWKSIEGYENELAPEQKALDAYYRQHRCPRCGGACGREMATSHAFSDPNTLTPRSLLRCLTCRGLHDPHTGMQLELGNPALAPPDIPIVGTSG